MKYQTLIGLEIHVELLTASKIFCGCSTAFGGESNTHCCPVCLGLPGALPVLNKKVVEFAVKAGLALNCNIASVCKMDRKNYFYPDLPKAFQTSQYDMPICTNGYIEIDCGKKKKIRIKRVHIEEDAGKTMHAEDGVSLIDYNRCGVPLIEIVTQPDMTSSEEAYKFLERLKSILQYTEVSDCRMEQGSLRCDININVKSEDSSFVSNIVEVKNLNSFKAAAKAIEYEEKRHIDLLKKGENTNKETRRWDESKNKTVIMRMKENVEDYRYFPEPDLVKIEIDSDWVEKIRTSLPEMPNHKKERFIKDYGLPLYDAEILTSSKGMADFFEEVVKEFQDAKMVSNWVMTEFYRSLKESESDIENIKFCAKDFAKLLRLIKRGTISNNIGKRIFKEMYNSGKDPEIIVKEKGLMQISDVDVIKEMVLKVLEEYPESVMDYKNGKGRALGFLVGQVMKVSKGKANPQMVNKIIKKYLDT
ncbi:Asp-tRNA(Asn)/Glu-tRNA(Gln) amidotransferase subunit GatB [Crassaminicella thermophila]|uniref:Aspartyl/glutamyl-tRNA(Asn/Gln) amidotransferase subunit B n=1 Tax=Crassaminicella thermophila TaxID=2599308 RepID=A0A5C0SF52_CRATE|nr:Asp-tRNA(Asn)/Glu-tRNA(Gln) amidotransferase subunit GatB [Crassaminicella thermophila]QEK12971.1 Asp-tRNA(Asn)/Glu-tRNA(Gln) amidotransferase subunit GatB [Crassaminicella thermophila]